MDPETDSGAAEVLRRIRRTALGAYVLFAILVGFTRGFRAFVALTCTAALAIITFLWLEEIVTDALQPSAQLHPRRLVLKGLSRFVLLGVAAWVTVQVAKFDAVGVLLGFSVVVVGILGEAAYATYRSLTG
ncbi:MAG TPA: ATP synthase subunit I [Thermoanaerobaculia bacterium]|nr:ATP synthase subunit I [Thermoanaerobaculia bacterium]